MCLLVFVLGKIFSRKGAKTRKGAKKNLRNAAALCAFARKDLSQHKNQKAH
jgi:hypothetical protein